MFIPVISPDNERERDVHVSLETVTRFYRVPPDKDRFFVRSEGVEREVSRETFNLLKSLVLRP